jgi:hypothetical protein
LVLVALFTALILAACTPVNLVAHATRLNLDYGVVGRGELTAQWLFKPRPFGDAPLHIYLDGDGRPWHGMRPAQDPSGERLLSLELLQADPQGGYYLIRPCYHEVRQQSVCRPALWTSDRYGHAVVAVLRAAIEELEARAPSARGLRLIGYSGGGALAVLIAAQMEREDVEVITVASNLDTDAWTAYHRVTPLNAASNPTALSPEVRLRAVHLQGGRDAVVPPVTTVAYQRRFSDQQVTLYPDFDHRCCWQQQWPEILEQALLLLDQG